MVALEPMPPVHKPFLSSSPNNHGVQLIPGG